MAAFSFTLNSQDGAARTGAISTPRGLMTDREARTANLGGELLAVVW